MSPRRRYTRIRDYKERNIEKMARADAEGKNCFYLLNICGEDYEFGWCKDMKARLNERYDHYSTYYPELTFVLASINPLTCAIIYDVFDFVSYHQGARISDEAYGTKDVLTSTRIDGCWNIVAIVSNELSRDITSGAMMRYCETEELFLARVNELNAMFKHTFLA